MKSAALLALLLALPAAASAPETAVLTWRPECILQAVASRKNASLDASRRPPMVLFGSKIPLSRFLEAAKEQIGGFVPDRVMNMYVVKTDEIYLNDSASSYGRHGRMIDDSLAHEYAHYVQVVYEHADRENDPNDALETDAVAVQTWFREQGAAALPPACRL